MCTVSMVTGYWQENNLPKVPPGLSHAGWNLNSVTREEFEALRKEVLELKKLLEAAKAYDNATNQHNCQKEENVKIIKQIAENLGVDLNDLLD